MSRGGHNWKGSGTVEGSRSLSVMKLARAGFLSGRQLGSWQWTNRGDITATIQIVGERASVTLHYRVRAGDEEWQPVHQRVPIRWTPCRFGGERPWFLCDVHSNGVYCGRQVAKLYRAGRLFACRHCYRLGYAIQRDGPMDRAHHRLRRLHRKLGADYDGADGIPPPKRRSGCGGGHIFASYARSRRARANGTRVHDRSAAHISPGWRDLNDAEGGQDGHICSH